MDAAKGGRGTRMPEAICQHQASPFRLLVSPDRKGTVGAGGACRADVFKCIPRTAAVDLIPAKIPYGSATHAKIYLQRTAYFLQRPL